MPRPVECDRNMLRNSGIGFFDRIYAEGVIKELIKTNVKVVKVPDEHVIYNNDSVKVSKAVLVRGNAFGKFLQLADSEGLLPQSQKDHNAFRLWRHFQVDLSVDELHGTVTMVRYPHMEVGPRITWRNEDAGGRFLSEASKIAILTLAVVPYSAWEEIVNKGFVVGQLTGDIYDPWRAEGSVVLYPVKENILGFNGRPGIFIAEEAYWLGARLHNNLDQELNKQRQTYVASHDVVGVFADPRTMK